ncbi:LamG-like jellyroll fold domain-containing protein [Lentzea sp. NBRC 105346]|uniref:LamG-like jellyroll fold domain-containing protein n=1 Tax=Lentzea sp. NBRC 105346 TaxID=3032205 RepID=UPI0025537E99|nr:LamG-like jellyroll fold domain-containing protein [Lentzea sp. NBRC 105346]
MIVLTGCLTPSVAAAESPVPNEVADAATAERLAAESGKPIVISSETTETAQVTANPDGSRTLVDYTLPVRVKQNGAWAAVDLTLVQRGDGTVAPKAAPVTMAFTAGGAGSAVRGPVAKLVKDTAEVGFGWDTDLPAVRISGSTATYPEILPGVDLELKAALTGFSQSLVVKTPEAARNPKLTKVTFKSHTKNVTISKTTTPSAASDQPRAESLVVTNAAGQQVFGGDASTMVDSSQDTRRAVMAVEVGSNTVSITPNQAFLADPSTRYPVRLDPDYYCNTCTKAHHAVVQSPPEWANARNYDHTDGQLGDLKAGYLNAYSLGATQNGISRTYIAMNTWSLHSRVIHWAKLNAKVIHSHHCAEATATELWLTNGIDENTTWNNQPAWAYSLSDNNTVNNVPYCQTNGLAEFDATKAVRHIADTNQSYATFMLKAKEESSLDASWRRFDLNPFLEVHYNTIPNTPTDLGMEGWGPNGADALPCRVGESRPAVFTRTPEMRARVSDLDEGTMNAGFRVYKGTSTNYTWGGQEAADGNIPSGSFARARPLSRWISEDGIYTWQMWSGDYESSSWSALCEFEVDSVAPNAPTVVSTDFPQTGPGGPVGRTGNFTITPNGNTGLNGKMDIDHYAWALNSGTVGTRVDVKTADGKVVVPITPTRGGTNMLYVQAIDRAGNRLAEPVTYKFNVADPAGPVGAWLLDEKSGTTAADTSGRNHPLTLAGNAAFGSAYSGNGQAGNGSSAYSATSGPIIDTSRAFSVSAWVKLDNTNLWSTAVSQEGLRASGFLLEYSKDRDRWTFSAGQSDANGTPAIRAESAASPQLGAWTHLLGTYEPNSHKLSLYVNGKLEGAADATLWNAGGPLLVGAGKWDSSRGSYFAGTVDHVQVWDRVLSATEAAQHNNLVVLRARYGLDELTGTVTKDDVSGQNGTLGGGVTWAAKPVDPTDVNPNPVGEEKWLHYDDSSTGEVVGPRPATLRTDRSFTVSAWVRHSGLDGGPRAAVGMGDAKFSPFMLGYRSEWGKWGLLLTESPTSAGSRFALSDQAAEADTWVHLAASYDAVDGTIALYVNGVKQSAFMNTDGKGLTTFNASGPFLVGRGTWEGHGSDWWKGDLDDARIYSGVLTLSEIEQLYSATNHY